MAAIFSLGMYATNYNAVLWSDSVLLDVVLCTFLALFNDGLLGILVADELDCGDSGELIAALEKLLLRLTRSVIHWSATD